MLRVTLRPAGAGEPVDVTIEREDHTQPNELTVHCAGDVFEVEADDTGPGAGWLRVNGRVTRYYAMHRDQQVQVWCGGRVWSFERIERVARRAADTAQVDPTEKLTAPMPGTILKTCVAQGDAFDGHTPLIIMESMKMELTLSAPHPGRIKRLTCQPGQLVEMGAILAELEPTHESEKSKAES